MPDLRGSSVFPETRLDPMLIVSSTLFDAKSGWFTRVMGRTLLRNIVVDQRAMEEQVTRSNLDWTILLQRG